MQKKVKEVSKKYYITICFSIIGIGLIINAIFQYLNTFDPCNRYYQNYMNIAGIIIGYGIGLAMAHTYKIKDV